MAMMSSASSKTLLTMTLALATVAAAAAPQPSPGVSTTTMASTINLTLHNLCPYPVWPLVTANAGVHLVPTDADGEPAGRLDGNGEGLATLAFPLGAWSGHVVARTGCDEDTDDDDSALLRCATGDAPPMTVAHVSVGGLGGAAGYSVSLVDGFNVAVVVTLHGMPTDLGTSGRSRRCPTVGCAVDLAAECPGAARALRGGCSACATHFCPNPSSVVVVAGHL